MNEWLALAGTVLGAAIGAAAVILTARLGRKTAREENEAKDWSGFTAQLQEDRAWHREQIARQDAKISDLYERVGALRTALESEQHRSSIIMRYLRVVLAWALELLPPGSTIPAPPSEISAEISDLTGGGDGL